MTLYARRCSIASAAEDGEVDHGAKSPSHLQDEGQEDTRTERVDFVFRPPKPQELRVGVEVYYKTNDRSPSFAKERYGNKQADEGFGDH
jgi:hypothetical protein